MRFPCAFYDIDNDAAPSAAVRLLYQLGHRRIAFINGPRDLVFARQRLVAFKRELAKKNIVVPEMFISHDEIREDLGYKRAAIMLGSNDSAQKAGQIDQNLTPLV